MFLFNELDKINQIFQYGQNKHVNEGLLLYMLYL